MLKLRTRHCAALFLSVVVVVVATLAWWLIGPLGAVAAVGCAATVWITQIWLIRRKPEYHERKVLYRRLEHWIDAHACGDLLEVDGLLVRCCSHMIGPHVRLWPRHSADRHVRVDDYMVQDVVPGVRHGMMLGTINECGELEIPQPTSLRAVIHKARFEQDSGVLATTVTELRDLLDRLDRAAPMHRQR